MAPVIDGMNRVIVWGLCHSAERGISPPWPTESKSPENDGSEFDGRQRYMLDSKLKTNTKNQEKEARNF